MNGVADGVRFHARPLARVVGATCLALGVFLAAGAFLASDVGPFGAVAVVIAAGVFVYFGAALSWGYVSAVQGLLTIREGLRVRRIDAAAITGLELCEARLYIAGQRTVGAYVGGELLRLNLLARYPTGAGTRRLEEQQKALRGALAGGPANPQ